MFIKPVNSFSIFASDNRIKRNKDCRQTADRNVNLQNKKEFTNPIITANNLSHKISFSARKKSPNNGANGLSTHIQSEYTPVFSTVYPVIDSKDYPIISVNPYPTIDSFTGLRDKECLITDLDNMIAEKSEAGEDISIAMFDMDNFKSVNELLGYKTGDEFIKSMSTNIGKIAEENNLEAYRFGGDEFVIIFDKQTKEEQSAIVENILSFTNSDNTFKVKENEYIEKANTRLQRLDDSNSKIHKLSDLKAQSRLLNDLHKNMTTEAARNDSYLLENITSTNQDIKSLYKELIDESIPKEKNETTKADLTSFRDKLEKDEPISDEEKNILDEYLHSRYYKSPELSQTRKWLNDFNKNNGFSVTGGVVTFSCDYYKTKDPIDLVDETGECLKKGKNHKKGTGYYSTKTKM